MPGRGTNWNGFEIAPIVCVDGPWVKWEDYAALAAENERLRKAGDAMHAAAVQDSTALWVLKPFQDWNAAKEGGAK